VRDQALDRAKLTNSMHRDTRVYVGILA
jgi:hypothetical protein